jgi:hypothetical protein
MRKDLSDRDIEIWTKLERAVQAVADLSYKLLSEVERGGCYEDATVRVPEELPYRKNDREDSALGVTTGDSSVSPGLLEGVTDDLPMQWAENLPPGRIAFITKSLSHSERILDQALNLLRDSH